MKRFQVADDGKAFDVKGPDLYRTWNADGQGDEAARARVKNIVPESHDLFWRTGKRDGGWSKWKGNEKGTGLDRGHVLSALDDWAAAPDYDKQVAQVGVEGSGGNMNVTAKIKALLITVQQLSGATDATEQVWAMIDRRWPQTTFAGAKVCKPYSHGYGSAVDASYGPTADVFDWAVRMARAGLAPAQQLIGTTDGHNEKQAWEPDFAIEPYNGNGSHAWHLHWGVAHAHDANPPCLND